MLLAHMKAAMLHMPEFPVLDRSQSKGHLQMLRQVNGHGMLLIMLHAEQCHRG